MSSIRQNKIAALLQREMGTIFQQEARSWCLGAMVTVTVVRATSDLSIARVYVSIFGGPDAQEVLAHIKANQSAIRGRLGSAVGKQLRKVPDLEFYIDDSLDYAENIEQLLKK